MSSYHYRAYNAGGETVTGVLEAGSLGAVEHRLRAEGVWLLEARERKAASAAGPAPVRRRKRGASVKRRDLVAFFVETSLLLRAGITLPRALERLAEDFHGRPLGAVVGILQEQVTAGLPLHQAMAAQPRVFPPAIVAVVQAGEVGGKLPDVFESLTAYYQWLDQLVGDIRQALIYPLIVTGATLALVLGLFTFIVPRFVELLEGLSIQVPLMTRVVMAISRVLVQDWLGLLILAAGIPLALRIALLVPEWAGALDRALMRLPVFGPLITMFALSRFTQNLGMLHRAGIPLLRGLDICRHVVGNRAVAQALAEARRGVSEGAPLSRCLKQHDLFPPSLVTMIAAGEASGKLDFSLQSISAYYNQVIPRRIKAVFSIFDPVMMLILIAVVGAVALSVVLPILQLWQAK